MSLPFWRKKVTTASGPDEVAVPVAILDPMPMQIVQNDETEQETVPVEVKGSYLPPIAGVQTEYFVQVPGIGTGSAYADGDAFGSLIKLSDVFRSDKRSGTIVKVVLYDLDDEGLPVDFVFFRRSVTATADNSAFAISDTDNLASVGFISVTDFRNWGNNQLGQNITDRLWCTSDSTDLYLLLVIRGAANVAAGSEPWITVSVVPN